MKNVFYLQFHERGKADAVSCLEIASLLFRVSRQENRHLCQKTQMAKG